MSEGMILREWKFEMMRWIRVICLVVGIMEQGIRNE